MIRKNNILAYVLNPLRRFTVHVLGACRDLFPIIVVIVFFQLVVLRQPFPETADVIVGLILVILGLALFVVGLEIGLFPLGEAMLRPLLTKEVFSGYSCLGSAWAFQQPLPSQHSLQ